MANQAEKKAVERVKKFKKEHGSALLILLALYLTIRVGLQYSTCSTSLIVLFVFFALVEYWCYGMLCGHLESGQLLDGAGGLIEPSRDILYVLMLAQAVSLVFGDSFLWISAVIPAFAGYKALMATISSWSAPRPIEPEEVLSKTQQKKQRKIEKFGHR